MNLLSVETTTGTRYMSILLDSLRIDSVLDFDLFIKVENQMVLYRSAELPFTEHTRQTLLENRVEHLFIADSEKKEYQKYIETNLPQILSDPKVEEVKKANILYECSTNLVQDVLENPTYGDNIHRSKDLVENTINYILQGRDAFVNLLKITSFDYYTYTHSVNVCTFSIALARQMGIDDEKVLHELGVGALLHDIGKSRVPDNILRKKTKLTGQEFEIMKSHPQWGVDLLTETDEVAADCYYPVLEHHERGDREGYPHNLSLNEMHLYSQIVAICDTFDAMTTERVYQGAINTYSALKAMFSLTGAYDENLMRAFVQLMGPEGLRT